jgi:hypothetical protein
MHDQPSTLGVVHATLGIDGAPAVAIRLIVLP